jgi:hypothetical protein
MSVSLQHPRGRPDPPHEQHQLDERAEGLVIQGSWCFFTGEGASGNKSFLSIGLSETILGVLYRSGWLSIEWLIFCQVYLPSLNF